MEIKNFRARTFIGLLYLDNKKHMEILENLKLNYEIVYIKHEEEEQEKKEHIHFLINFKNSKWYNSLIKEIEIENQFLQKCKNVDKFLLYMIHFEEENKKAYTIEEVKGNKKLIDKLIHLVNNYDKNENEKVLEILEFIEYNNISNLKDLIRFSCLNDTYYIVRKAQNLFVKLIQENQMNNNINNEKFMKL